MKNPTITNVIMSVLISLLDLRFLIMAVPSFAYLFISNDGKNADIAWTMIYAIAVMTAFTAVTHLIRKLLFPYIDLKQFATQANLEPKSAAIVFASVCFVLSVVLFSMVYWIK